MSSPAAEAGGLERAASGLEPVSGGPRPLRVAFAGTPDFARVALEAIAQRGHELVLVLSQPDRPAGRGMKLQASPVKAAALAHGLPVVQPRSLRLDGKFPDDARDARQALLAAGPDVMVVAAYGLILPQWALDLPHHGCLNIHASLLPRWRGAAPIHRAIEAGDVETGITIMQMDAGLDTGDMLLTGRVPIAAVETTASLHDTLAALGGRLVVDALDALPGGGLVRQPQPADGVTYAHKVEKAEAAIDWRLPADVIERRIRAFDPFPGAFTNVAGETIKLWRAELMVGAVGGPPGEVVAVDEHGFTVACGTGALKLIEVQRPGGRRITARQLVASGWPGVGDRLSQVEAV